MFNDDLLLGKVEVILDKKRRFFIPACSGVEGGEKVVIKRSELRDKKVLKLIDYRKLLEEVNKLKKKQESATNSNDYLFYQNMIEELCAAFEHVSNVDSQHRISLPESLADYIEIKPNDVMVFEGLGYSYAISRK